MATIKAIESRSVHQIQSGQVIVDLCSVVKELVENSLDAGATSIEVRLKNNGLDLIEVQDNGSGISPSNYENIALKHYTSKLSTYNDLTSLQTFGFRGEALSSLCALSNFQIVTAQADQAPKATKLEFEISGKLKGTQTIAGKKGTTASVADLFRKLPVRRRELEKNIKREYGKVLGLLHAYACISTGVRFSVKNHMSKGKSVVVFATNENTTTKMNIANVYGAKTLLALIPLDLELEFQSTVAGRRSSKTQGDDSNRIFVHGHISRPVFGEGRQTPDRQMFFVNSRPCGLPQISKAFNEVYKSFNVSQSPFIFADFQMDTNAYDVNVSPDKRTILLHDSGALIESLKESLVNLFNESDQTVPQSLPAPAKQSLIRTNAPQIDTANRIADSEIAEAGTARDVLDAPSSEKDAEGYQQGNVNMKTFLENLTEKRLGEDSELFVPQDEPVGRSPPEQTEEAETSLADEGTHHDQSSISEVGLSQDKPSPDSPLVELDSNVDQVDRIEPHQSLSKPRTDKTPLISSSSQPGTQSIVQNAFDRMRPRRTPAEVATITVGDETVTSIIGSGLPKKRGSEALGEISPSRTKPRTQTSSRPSTFARSIKDFAAPGSQLKSTEVDVDRNSGEEQADSEDAESGDDSESGQDIQMESAPESPGHESHAGHDSEEQEEESEGQEQEEDEGQRDEEEEVDYGSGNDTRTQSRRVETDSDGEYIDEAEKKRQEEARVQELIREAEVSAAVPSENNLKRANNMAKGLHKKDATVQLMATVDGSYDRIKPHFERLQRSLRHRPSAITGEVVAHETSLQQDSAEVRLSLTVSKEDFSKMRIVGQFNLGFILATRSPDQDLADGSGDGRGKDELFIIDQHASDEKFNFERLQAETVVQNQRLVKPKILDLTAVEEEVVIDNLPSLEKNGFIVEVDTSGDEPIGRRCKLLSLPLSKEVVFDIRDLEELIVLLSESPHSGNSASSSYSDMYVPRPSKVRKMFAMRACRSSVMVGKTLTLRQMGRVVRHMGAIDKPWNCPHGRPTMRHLMSLGDWNEWNDFDWTDPVDSEENQSPQKADGLIHWKHFFGDYVDVEA